MRKDSTFTFDANGINRLTSKLLAVKEKLDKNMDRKMEAATRLVYAAARTRRPYVGKGKNKVSDPSAAFGVPVAAKNGGALRASISKEVVRKAYSVQGKVKTGIHYAKYLEFGTSKMAARPFMRPALERNSENLKKIFRTK